MNDPGCAAGSGKRCCKEPPDHCNHRSNTKIDWFACVPEGRNHKNEKGNRPSRRDPNRAPRKTHYEQSRSTQKLDHAPAEPAIRPSDREVNPAMSVVKQHHANSGAEKGK